MANRFDYQVDPSVPSSVSGPFKRLQALLSLFRRSPDAGYVMDSSFLELQEISDPPAPAANRVRIYARDNGAGKTQFCARFATGAVQVISTEP